MPNLSKDQQEVEQPFH